MLKLVVGGRYFFVGICEITLHCENAYNDSEVKNNASKDQKILKNQLVFFSILICNRLLFAENDTFYNCNCLVKTKENPYVSTIFQQSKMTYLRRNALSTIVNLKLRQLN